jgi:predicted glycoside hydrolase/deacetylase ChbG (UPF0249 family)
VPVTRQLIVNADDFGLSESVNTGVARGFEQGIVTSASLMVDRPAAVQAARYAADHPGLSVGLHLDLGEWEFDGRDWRCVRRVLADQAPAEAVAAEVQRQLTRFRVLTGTGPTHIDSHQHVHRDDPVRTVVESVGATIGATVRGLDESVEHVGAFYGQTDDGEPLPDNISVTGLMGILARLGPAISEVACHPAIGKVPSLYDVERSIELETLCDSRVRQAVVDLDIVLCSFRDRP